VFLAGGAEKGSSPLGMAGFSAARALSTRNDNPLKQPVVRLTKTVMVLS
jgi:3-oxoacyl-(acyl-carrier-protein) synthase